MILPYQIFQKFNIYLENFIRKMNNKIIVMNIVRKKINNFNNFFKNKIN